MNQMKQTELRSPMSIAIVEYVKAHPGCTTAEIAAGVNYPGGSGQLTQKLGSLGHRLHDEREEVGRNNYRLRWWVA